MNEKGKASHPTPEEALTMCLGAAVRARKPEMVPECVRLSPEEACDEVIRTAREALRA